jgi:hypothetical protein
MKSFPSRLLALAVGVFSSVGYLFAAPPDIVTFCYRGRTMKAPEAIAQRYLTSGATPGPCVTSAP